MSCRDLNVTKRSKVTGSDQRHSCAQCYVFEQLSIMSCNFAPFHPIVTELGWWMSYTKLEVTNRSKVTDRGQKPFEPSVTLFSKFVCMRNWARHILAITLFLVYRSDNVAANATFLCASIWNMFCLACLVSCCFQNINFCISGSVYFVRSLIHVSR